MTSIPKPSAPAAPEGNAPGMGHNGGPPLGAAGCVPVSIPIGKPFERFAGPSRSTQYALDKAGEIRTFLVGNRRYVIVQSWFDYVERQRRKEAARRAAGIRPLMRGEAR